PLHPVLYFLSHRPTTTEIYTLSLHDALPISMNSQWSVKPTPKATIARSASTTSKIISFLLSSERERRSPNSGCGIAAGDEVTRRDRKSTRLNSSHVSISYAVFCLKKKNNKKT